jgi:acyl-CoA thioester hydrolase
VAYYHVLFDRAVDEFLASLGLGLDYVRGRQASVFALEDHVCYIREVKAGDIVQVEIRLLDHDAKRIHFFMTLTHKAEGFVSATAEHLSMHVDLTSRKSAPFPPDVLEIIERTASVHSKLPRPERAGRTVAIRRRPG